MEVRLSSTSTPTTLRRHRGQNTPHSVATGRGLPSAQRPARTTGAHLHAGPGKAQKKGLLPSPAQKGGRSYHQAPGCFSCHRIRSLPGAPGPGGRTPGPELPSVQWMRSFRKLGGETDSRHALLQRWERSEARRPQLASVSRHIKTVWDASCNESEAQFTLFWFRMRWFFIIIFFSLGRRVIRNQGSKYSESGRHLGAEERFKRNGPRGATWRPLPAAPGTEFS